MAHDNGTNDDLHNLHFLIVMGSELYNDKIIIMISSSSSSSGMTITALICSGGVNRCRRSQRGLSGQCCWVQVQPSQKQVDHTTSSESETSGS